MTDKPASGDAEAGRSCAPGSACCRAGGSTCSIRRPPTSRSRTSPTGWPASRAGTARRSAITPSRWRSTRCWWSRSPPRCSPTRNRRWLLAALLHDAPEYVIGDLISPFKAAIGLDYKAFEVQAAASHPSPLRPAADPAGSGRRRHQACRPRRRLLRGNRACGLQPGGGRPLLRRAQRPSGGPAADLESPERTVGCRRPGRVPGALQRSCGKVTGRRLFGTLAL